MKQVPAREGKTSEKRGPRPGWPERGPEAPSLPRPGRCGRECRPGLAVRGPEAGPKEEIRRVRSDADSDVQPHGPGRLPTAGARPAGSDVARGAEVGLEGVDLARDDGDGAAPEGRVRTSPPPRARRTSPERLPTRALARPLARAPVLRLRGFRETLSRQTPVRARACHSVCARGARTSSAVIRPVSRSSATYASWNAAPLASCAHQAARAHTHTHTHVGQSRTQTSRAPLAARALGLLRTSSSALALARTRT